MKKLSILVVFLVLTSVFAFADWMKLPGSKAVDVAVAENGIIVIANTAGEVWLSKDVGATWNKCAGSDVIRISMSSDASIIGAVNKKGDFYYSKDKGASWTKAPGSSVLDASVGKTNSFVVNTKGEVYYTKSDFKSWTKTNVTNMKLVVFGGPFILLVDNSGGIHVADFSNKPDLAVRKTSGSSVVDIDVSPKGHLWVANDKGEMYSSSDKGASWVKTDGSDVIAVSICNKYTVVVNKKGEIYKKDN